MWSKLDDNLMGHPKVLEARELGGEAAFTLLIGSWCYCAKYLTNGFIASAAITSLVPGMEAKTAKTLAAVLVKVGLWEQVPGGWQVHDWDDYNPTAEEVQQKRKSDRERMQAWRARHGVTPSVTNGVTDAVTNAVTHATPVPVPVPVQDPVPVTNTSIHPDRSRGPSAAVTASVGLSIKWNGEGLTYSNGLTQAAVIQQLVTQEGATLEQVRRAVTQVVNTFTNDDRHPSLDPELEHPEAYLRAVIRQIMAKDERQQEATEDGPYEGQCTAATAKKTRCTAAASLENLCPQHYRMAHHFDGVGRG